MIVYKIWFSYVVLIMKTGKIASKFYMVSNISSKYLLAYYIF